ncbi:hypothetical protein [Amycolatopsis sp. H20-H5]|uniref:hypothetical protein n=1 Tax=Amycolatopsis sp. H20-H5 TaxID=3046309 RepID=UPI002DB9A4F9|nr:hypothetical protein [Amycolatopsis sp. H20-H5]MEC3981034.1 hypothetical protein [Amycolatopsis sp. H20-H5]
MSAQTLPLSARRVLTGHVSGFQDPRCHQPGPLQREGVGRARHDFDVEQRIERSHALLDLACGV